MIRPVLVLAAAAAAAVTTFRAPDPELFHYDAADTLHRSTSLAGAGAHQPALVAHGERLWAAWLEYAPESGDRLRVASRTGNDWEPPEHVPEEARRLSHPTLTVDASGALWLGYEAERDGAWAVLLRRRSAGGEWSAAIRVDGAVGHALRHAVAADPGGGLWVVWQAERNGSYDVLARHVDVANRGAIEVVADTPRGNWHPTVAAPAEDLVCVAWDASDGESFDVRARWRTGGRTTGSWGTPRTVAGGPAFQGRARLAAGDGRAWIAWEEGAVAWGRAHRGRIRLWTNITDAYGPVHRRRTLELASLGPEGDLRRPVTPLPMPSLELARSRTDVRPGVRDLGVFYERAELAVDGSGRPWIAYRHFYATQVGCDEPVAHHAEDGWRIDARRLSSEGWGPLVAFDAHQRDGMQRLAIAAQGDELAAVWGTGRTDRREDPHARGVVAGVTAVSGEAGPPRLFEPEALSPVGAPSPRRPRPQPERVGETEYGLYFGDLHRHTDLSLCFPFFDGSIDDAYRYAVEVAELDFLAITDHARDLDRGDVRSTVWWRSTKEVRRAAIAGTFAPLFGYERSHRDTDHNVISLTDGLLRNYPPPLPEFWNEIDGDAITIPHNPFIGKVWEYQDDGRRPLLEVYQGCRDEESERHAREGFRRGYHLGLIASSDHMSTSASFACVWAEDGDRESIFRALQARRTYAATAKIRLVLRAGDAWMGERVVSSGPTELRLDVEGTAAIESIDWIVDGEVASHVEGTGERSLRSTYVLPHVSAGESYAYARVRQADGERAWSSPIWVRRE